MEKGIIPPEKYVEKALIDQIFASTVGIHSQSHQEMPRYFQILRKNLLDSITIKQPIDEEEKNKQNIHRKLQIKITKNDDNWNKIIKYRKTLNNRKGLSKRSFTSKYSSLNLNNKKNRDILSSFGFRTINKDFTDITININYLLEKNQHLLLKEKNFMNGFDFSHKNKLDNKMFKRKLYSSRSGVYGKKEEVPLIYEQSFTHKNFYISKSEKSRHEYLLNELNKLKFYLERRPFDKLLIIKDFFLKFNIKDLNKYSDEDLLSICNIISSSDQYELLKIIKPDKNIKTMVYNLLNIPSIINQNKKNYRKLNIPYSGYTPNYYHKRSRNPLLDNKNIFGIFDTNSKLKYIENQNRLYKPEKDYSKHLDLIINEIGKEVKDIKDSISNTKEVNGEKNIFFITQSKNRTISYKTLDKKRFDASHMDINKYNPNNNKGTFLFFRKSLSKNKSDINNIKKLNLCLKTKKFRFDNDTKNKLYNEVKNKKKDISRDLVQRLYYKYHSQKLGFNEVKRNKKLTEFIALHLAKKKSRIRNLVSALNQEKKSYSYNL